MASATPALASDVFAGRHVYEAHCITCHGANGRPAVPGAPDFSYGVRLELPDVMLLQALRRGKNLMPAYDRIISESDMLNVLAYIRTLRR